MVSVLFQELAEHESLRSQAFGVIAVGKKILQFVAKYRDTTWFQANHGDAGRNQRRQRTHDLFQQALGARHHAVVV